MLLAVFTSRPMLPRTGVAIAEATNPATGSRGWALFCGAEETICTPRPVASSSRCDGKRLQPPLVRSPELRQPLVPVRQAERLLTFLTGGLAVFQGLIIQPVQLPQALVHQRAFCL